jgi:biotin carboxyl carrier protein
MTADAARTAGEFTITLDGVDYPVDVQGGSTQSSEQGPWKITVNGRSFTVKLAEDGMVLVDGIAYDVTVDGETVRAGEASHAMEVSGLSLGQASPGASTGLAGSTEATEGAGAVVAIMPGQVTRVLVQEGQEIKEGEAVCVLEAMKMENELRADRDGVVRAVHVQPGEDVEKDQMLVELEPVD